MVEKRGLPEYVTTGFSRAEWHDKAWALYHAKTFDDTMLKKVNIHTLRTLFDATYDALMGVKDHAVKITAKPIEWTTGDSQQWDECLYGFSIIYDDEVEEDYRYQACWGEGTEAGFATLTEAQQWCQDTIDAWMRSMAVVTPNASHEGPDGSGVPPL